METKTKSVSKRRQLPEIPKDKQPYDVNKPPTKPPRQITRRSSNPDLRLSSSLHKRSGSLTEAQLSSVKFGNDDAKRSSGAGQTSTTNSRGHTFPPRDYSCDVIFTRRFCCQRIFPEREECLVAQSRVFHATCFRCAICDTGLDVTNYCYLMHHEKFYCFEHCNAVNKAEEGLGNEGDDINEAGPGAFVGNIMINVIYDKKRRKQMLKKLVEFQHRRGRLEKVALQLQETIRTAKREDKLLLWKHLCDVNYEKTMIMRVVTEIAYQLKEGDLCDEQEELQRRLRRLKKRRDEGTREENNEQEEEFLRNIVDVIEKRDLLLVELEIERRRDDADVQKLKSKLEHTDAVNENRDGSTGISSNELRSVVPTDGQCLIL